MATDNLRTVLFNAGEQGVAVDFNALQRQSDMRFLEQFLMPAIRNTSEPLTIGDGPFDPEITDRISDDPAYFPSEFALTPHPARAWYAPNAIARQVELFGSGPLIQLVNDSSFSYPDENFEPFLIFTGLSFEHTLTTDVGDASPRIDIVEMKLEREDAGAETRVYSQESVRSSLDLDPLTLNVDTIIRARVGGVGGDNISIELTPDGTGAGNLTYNGNAVTYHFEDSITTVADFETAIAASTLIEVMAAGTPANIFANPNDVLAATPLAGGSNQILVGSSLNKARRVKATFQIKKGTAGATPAHPPLTAGYCAVAAIRIPALHNAAHDVENIRDLRYPLGGVRVFDVQAHEFKVGVSGVANDNWTVTNGTWYATGPAAGSHPMYAMCPFNGAGGRLIGVAVRGANNTGAGMDIDLVRVEHTGTGNPTITVIGDLSAITDGIDNVDPAAATVLVDEAAIMDATRTTLGETQVSGSRVGSPVWTNGRHCGLAKNNGFDQSLPQELSTSHLALQITGELNNRIHFVRFYVAHGI